MYLFELLRRGGSNECPQSMFWAEIWKISVFLSENFQFLVKKFSIKLNRHVFVMPDFKVISQVFLLWPFTKIAKTSSARLASTAKNRKKNFKHLFGQWPDFKMISQKCSSYLLYQNCPNGSGLLNKMVTRAKNRKTFKPRLSGQWQDFKIISHQCSSYAPLPKLLKWFCSAEQNGCQS